MEKLLTEKDAAEILNVGKGTLRNWRFKNEGPPFVKLETGSIRYKEVDLKNWINKNNEKGGGDENHRI